MFLLIGGITLVWCWCHAKEYNTDVQPKLQRFIGKGRCRHLSVSATRLRRYSFAVSRDERRRIPTPTRLFYEESQISKRQARLLQEGGLVVSSRQERLYTGIRSYITRLHQLWADLRSR